MDYRTATFRQSHTLEPSQQFFVAEHESSCEITSFAVLFFAPILQRMDESYSSFVHQFLQVAAIVDGLLNLGRQFIGYVN